MKKVLLTSNLTQESLSAIRTGLAFADKIGADYEFWFANNLPDQVHFPYLFSHAGITIDENLYRKYEDDSKQEVKKFIADNSLNIDESKVRILWGSPITHLTDEKEISTFDCLFLGHSPKLNETLYYLGSTTEGLMHNCPKSLYINKDNEVNFPKKILVAIDFDDFSKKVLSESLTFANQLGAEVTVYHAAPCFYQHAMDSHPIKTGADLRLKELNDTQFEEVKTKFAELEKEVRAKHTEFSPDKLKFVLDKDLTLEPHKTITEQGKAHDLVVVGTHSRGAINRFFLGSVATKIVRESETDVLIIK